MKNPLCSLACFSVSNKKSLQCSQLPEGLCCHFSLAEIKAATNNFKADSVIGRDSYGNTYKGTTNDGTIVAVKRWQRKNGSYRASEFQNELLFLCQLRNPHLVSLLGISEDGNEMILVYEYTSRGAFSDHLYGEGYAPLHWKQRLQICIGAARGLHYLHTGVKHAVFHCDIKTSNILIDEECSSKLSGFGLSKLGPRSMSKALIRKESRITGTYGYMAPEYALHGELTDRSDVYSFGVVLFEVLFGRRVYDAIQSWNLLEYAQESLREGTIYHAIDPHLKGRIAPQCLDKYLEIAISCVHRIGNERPAMGEVEVTLELALELQGRADAEMQATNPCGECMYEQVLFSAFPRKFTGLDIPYDPFGFSDSDDNNSSQMLCHEG
ncbi:hypothetical protein V6N11_077095 [Hibiscus sabdariffa]|uniref:Protein kinase domain-containing protein n=1 Tax=Hibiscus sabdariffa TaxID=183260 RepID=A0ABR2TCT3_9ROSI